MRACRPHPRALLRFAYLQEVLWEMAAYWCRCLRYAPLCGRGRCPVDATACAAALPAVLAAWGSLVRANFYVFLRGEVPERFYLAVAKAASRLFTHLAQDGYILYEDLVTEAAILFLEVSRRKVYPPPTPATP
ncbi:hypothetical protein Pogu_0002 [Pyrobaculum oguniense TE7]|uniref:Uncharacterized protein n=1 Tax=Pyrobaculum oguniense (strain DSM 13380 / JCM 10595 / TE7) TaxID=698757 RepID=H6Q5Z9_PYROT|nr:hypothetical protein Pogu_0002 [Pyrobaculum oguniense TE7]